MQILYGLHALPQLPRNAVVSIGNFDGVHRGHQHILRLATRLKSQSNGPSAAVITFEPHPLTVLRPEMVPPRLSAADRKQQFIADAGIDHLLILPPEPAVLELTAEMFWRRLSDAVKPTALVEGRSFSFGKGRSGTVERLKAWAEPEGTRVHVVPPVEVALLDMSLVPASSSLIRWLLAHGRVRDAAVCLGRPYELSGPVIQGHQRGRTIGVPTANLDCAEQLVPAPGVYAARTTVGGTTYAVALSIGTMPTFGDDHRRQVEAHLIGFDGDLYGQTLRLELLDWLRDQQKFASLDALKAQLSRDIATAATRHTLDAGRPVAIA